MPSGIASRRNATLGMWGESSANGESTNFQIRPRQRATSMITPLPIGAKASAIISKMADDDNAKTAEIKKRLSSVETTLARVRRDAFSLRDIDLPNPKANDFWVQDERMTGILNAKDASEQEYPLNSRNNSHIINPNLYDSAAERNSIWQILSSRSATDKAINDLEDAAAEAREKSERFSDKANDYWEKVGSPEIVFNVRKAAHYQKLEDGAEAAWSKQDEFDYAAFRLRRIYLARNGDAERSARLYQSA